MPVLGTAEIAIVLFVLILLFGAKKLPDLGSAVGETLRNLRVGARENPSGE